MGIIINITLFQIRFMEDETISFLPNANHLSSKHRGELTLTASEINAANVTMKTMFVKGEIDFEVEFFPVAKEVTDFFKHSPLKETLTKGHENLPAPLAALSKIVTDCVDKLPESEKTLIEEGWPSGHAEAVNYEKVIGRGLPMPLIDIMANLGNFSSA